MQQPKTAARAENGARRESQSQHEPLPTWRNTRPRGNPETHKGDLERSRERLESLVGR